ncbi:hypothetical protein HanRHA438_Chr14g0649471 [Helianthus annuus]|nr:hypothetical protein HanIR_Chr14g0693451 [Helianthus annuus]KAJ0853292.1 hypothetical protein HanRHA438_Chr14g0649471 [Helianthus annuus]
MDVDIDICSRRDGPNIRSLRGEDCLFNTTPNTTYLSLFSDPSLHFSLLTSHFLDNHSPPPPPSYFHLLHQTPTATTVLLPTPKTHQHHHHRLTSQTTTTSSDPAASRFNGVTRGFGGGFFDGVTGGWTVFRR